MDSNADTFQGSIQGRNFSVEPESIRVADLEDTHTEETRIVEFSLSSEDPYDRGFGVEILGHNAGEVRMDRLKNAAPLLFNHDWDKHIGRVIAAEIVNGRLHVKAQFSKASQLANEKFAMLQEGILREVSVGYRVNRIEDVDDKGTYRVTDWEPLEASFVTVPADKTVGYGRDNDSAATFVRSLAPQTNTQTQPEQPQENLTMSEETKTLEKPAVDIEVVTDNARKAEATRIREIQKFGARFNIDGERINQAIDKNEDARSFANFCLDNGSNNVINEDSGIGMSKKERAAYSFGKAVKAAVYRMNPGRYPKEWDLNGLEKEAHDACESRHEKYQGGVIIPFDMTFKRDLEAGTAAEGGALVADDLQASQFIDVLRNKSVALQAGAVPLTGLVGDLPIPRKTAGATFACYDEEGETSDDSTLAFDQVTLTPKRMSGRVPFSIQLMKQSTPNIDALIRKDLADGAAVALDLYALTGSGSSNQPTGVITTTGRNTVTFGAAATAAKVYSMISSVMEDNADSMSNVFAMTAAVWEKWALKDMGTDTGAHIIDKDDMIRRRKVLVTEQLSASDRVIYGNFNELIIGQWGGLELLADPYTKAATAQVVLNAHMFFDIAVRHPVAFCVSTDSGAQ